MSVVIADHQQTKTTDFEARPAETPQIHAEDEQPRPNPYSLLEECVMTEGELQRFRDDLNALRDSFNVNMSQLMHYFVDRSKQNSIVIKNLSRVCRYNGASNTIEMTFDNVNHFIYEPLLGDNHQITGHRLVWVVHSDRHNETEQYMIEISEESHEVVRIRKMTCGSDGTQSHVGVAVDANQGLVYTIFPDGTLGMDLNHVEYNDPKLQKELEATFPMLIESAKTYMQNLPRLIIKALI